MIYPFFSSSHEELQSIIRVAAVHTDMQKVFTDTVIVLMQEQVLFVLGQLSIATAKNIEISEQMLEGLLLEPTQL